MARFSNKIKKPFDYTNAADSAKPGYLQRKFDQVRKRQRDEAASKLELPNVVFQNFVRDVKHGP